MAPLLFNVSGAFLLLALVIPLLLNNQEWLSPVKQLLARSEPTCRCFPGDDCWPTEQEWNEFNKTLGGKLIATKPLASPCHHDSFGPYDAEKCAEIQAVWGFPETHYKSSSSVQAGWYANQSCDPFLPSDAPCVIGTYVLYAVNASDASDYQKTIEFTKARSIRLVIRNTAHDYMGKSTGAGAVAIWTHNLKDIQFLDYASPHYTGKAVKVGAGVQVFEVNEAAKEQGLVVVGGNCDTVGIAGGYSQGGGTSQLASRFGLAADQVLEWEVVTGTGELLVASQSENTDLYWALSGGGGGTYGVVLSMTSKAYPEMRTATANLTFTSAGVSQDSFYDAVETFISTIGPILHAGGVSIWFMTSAAFFSVPTTLPGGTKEQLHELLSPAIAKLEESGIQYTYFIDDFPTFYDSYKAMTPPSNITDFQLGGRLIPRSVLDSNPHGLVTALRSASDHGTLVSGVAVNVSRQAHIPDNGVNPALRNAAISIVIGTPFSYADWDQNLANQRLMTDVIIPPLEALTPGGGAYLNEADPFQPNWQAAFYGDKYEKLTAIKNKYDPDHIFYGRTAVGSEYWTPQADGRLCRA
ncbi:hypothetical protein VTN77DRAFT_722 [Rasamsonia byssochlamydoides]|uniref:uncharacterized protein n=1 Tax=Rasamsonia byssochlamydoides TaxID=89139 RepID=UPI0037428DC4